MSSTDSTERVGRAKDRVTYPVCMRFLNGFCLHGTVGSMQRVCHESGVYYRLHWMAWLTICRARFRDAECNSLRPEQKRKLKTLNVSVPPTFVKVGANEYHQILL